MAVKITKVDVWAVEIADQPGGLARVLEALAQAGMTVECCIARRRADRPGEGTVFIAPPDRHLLVNTDQIFYGNPFQRARPFRVWRCSSMDLSTRC